VDCRRLVLLIWSLKTNSQVTVDCRSADTIVKTFYFPSPQDYLRMRSNPLDQEIRSKIDSFLQDISQLVKLSALESVQQALGGSSRAPRPRAPRGRPAKTGRRGRTPSPEIAAMGEKLLAHIQANPGQRLEEIGRAMGTETSVLKRPIAKLVATRQLKTEGQRRGMRYHFAGGAKKVTARKARKAGKKRAKKAA
jgi:hypothetical protein